MSTLVVNVCNSIKVKPLKQAAAEGWKASYPAKPASRIVAFDGDTWLGEFVSKTGGLIHSGIRDGRRCFDPDDMVEAERTCYMTMPFTGRYASRLPFRRIA